MQQVEIRQNKWKWTLLLIFLLGGQIVTFYLVYFSGKYDRNMTLKVVYVILTLVILYRMYLPARQLIKNEPVLTLSKSEITINRKGKPVTYLWIQIIDWYLEKDQEKSNTYLILETAEGKKSTIVSWLEKKPAEIEELIITYSGKTPRFLI
jgi:hypothetical protein